MIHPLAFDINRLRNQTMKNLVVLVIVMIVAGGTALSLVLSGHGDIGNYISVAGTASAVTFIIAMLIGVSHNSAVAIQRINELSEESRSLVSMTLTAVALSLATTGLCMTATALLVILR